MRVGFEVNHVHKCTLNIKEKNSSFSIDKLPKSEL